MERRGKINPDILAAAPEFPSRPLNYEKLKDGVIVRVPNWLGDAIMTLPALMQLKKIIPEPHGLFVLCPKGLRDIFESLPMIDMVVPLEKVHSNWSRNDIKRMLRLQAGAGILFNNSLRDAVFMRLCAIRPLYGASARGRSLLLHRSFNFPPRISYDMNELHHTKKYLSIVKALGAPEWDGTLPEFKIKVPFEEINQNIANICEHPKLMTIAAGAAYGGSKRWASESFRKVANWWIDNGGIVAVLGSGKEADIAEEVIEELPADKAFNAAGKTDLSELMHLLDKSAVSVANDSGIMHLSAALGKPGVAIFGPTDWTATGPISDRWKILYDKQMCSPCFKRECPSGDSKCMKVITPEMVIEAVKEVFK
jgi:heptosyltransferase-2